MRYADLPFVVGEGANGRVREFVALLDAMDELKPRVEAGVLVDQRRWNLRLKSGIDIKLPESDPEAAIAELLTLQRQSRILEKDVLALDFRVPGRVFARLSEEAAAAWARRPRGQEGRPAMSKPLAPRMRQIPARKSALLSVLDVGASKIVCLIARLTPMEPSEALRGRTHRCKVLGVGHQRSTGVKGGAVVDLRSAEQAARMAIDAAERMAGVEVGGVIVNMSGGRLASRRRGADAACAARPSPSTTSNGFSRPRRWRTASPDATILHALPTAFRLDATRDIRDPKGMVGAELGVDLHLATCDSAAARNLMLVIERCHLRVEAMVATPYAAGLSTLVDDEAELGAAVVDFGGGSTTVGVFSGGRLIHIDAVALGGIHVTRDVARGLNVSVSDAERLKTLYGACIASPSDDRETIAAHRLGDDTDHPSHLPKSELARIIRPRIEEILELVRDRLRASGYAAQAGRRLVMTGGACQLTGMPELARTIISSQARIGRPLGIEGLPRIRQEPRFRRRGRSDGLSADGGPRILRSHAPVHAFPSGRRRVRGAGRTLAQGEFLRALEALARGEGQVRANTHSNRRRRASNATRQACRSI